MKYFPLIILAVELLWLCYEFPYRLPGWHIEQGVYYGQYQTYVWHNSEIAVSFYVSAWSINDSIKKAQYKQAEAFIEKIKKLSK